MAKRLREDSRSASPDSDPSSPAAYPIDADGQTSKYTHLDAVSPDTAPADVMKCSLPGHAQGLPFPSYEAYEIHYSQAHVNRCSECRKNFPTLHLLGLHIEETHDPLQDTLRARGEKTYGCFVEDCDRKCSTPEKRRRHLIDKHMFPKDYNFYVVNDGIDKSSSMLRSRHRRRSSAAAHAAQLEQRARRRASTQETTKDLKAGESIREGEEAAPSSNGDPDATEDILTSPPESKTAQSLEANESPEKSLDGLTSSMAALKFVPPSVKFGRGQRGGLSNR